MPRTSMDEEKTTYGTLVTTEYSISTGQLTYSNVQGKPNTQHHTIRVTTNTPGYRSLARGGIGASGDLPMNPFFYSENKVVHPYGKYLYYRPTVDTEGSQYGLISSGVIGHDYVPQSIRDSVDALAANKVLLKLKAQDVNLGVALGERRQTAQLFASTAKRVGGAMLKLKRGDFHGAASALGYTSRKRVTSRISGRSILQPSKGKRWAKSKALANDWLALQFGWRPLLSDLYGAAEALEDLYTGRPARFRVHKTIYRTINTDKYIGSINGVPVHVSSKSRYQRTYVLVFSYSPESYTALAAVGATNPLSVAWELLPWSFAIDWFIPIGQYLDAWDATVGYSFEKGCNTLFIKTVTENRCKGTVPEYGGFGHVDTKAYAETVWCERTPLSDFPTPILPSFGPRFNETRSLTALALIRQKLKL